MFTNQSNAIFYNINIVDFTSITLKQTHNENGSVTRTKSQDIPVNKNPQIPTPSSEPSAKNQKN